MNRFFLYALSLSCSLNLHSNAFVENKHTEEIIYKVIGECEDITLNSSIYPYPLSRVYDSVLLSKCEETEEILKFLNKKALNSKISIGYQTNSNDLYFQDSSERLYRHEHSFINLETFNKNKSARLKIRRLDNKYVYDDSYFSIFRDNKSFTVGKMSHWWSFSPETSLALSNASRPFPSATIENLIPHKIDWLSFLGPVNYKFLLGKLENNRSIPNAKFLGFKARFYPSNKFSWSVSRTAQYGGRGRPESLESLINLIIGRDNRNDSGIKRESEPGNQMATLELNLFPNGINDYVLYTQISGQDEAGYLPSRIIYNLGATKIFKNPERAIFNIDYTNTETKNRPNYSYNHFLYLDGWRYLKMPIGASIDADSTALSISYSRVFSNENSLKFKFLKADINKNNSEKNYILENNFEVNSFIIDFSKKFNDRFLFRLITNIDDDNPFQDDKFSIKTSVSMEYFFKN